MRYEGHACSSNAVKRGLDPAAKPEWAAQPQVPSFYAVLHQPSDVRPLI
jgi:hypothetical protein